MKKPNRFLAAALLGSAAIVTAVQPGFAEEKTVWRLFVADHSAPVVRVLDAAAGATIDSFDTSAPASLFATESRGTVFALQRNGDLVSAFDTGIAFGDHGDHGDIKVEAPTRLDGTISGKKPVHFVEHDGQIAVFFDDDGVARLFSEADIRAGAPAIRDVKTNSPHHGVAIALGDHVLVSEPHPDKPVDELPVGMRVLDEAGNPVGDLHACPDLHGEAASGDLVAIACAEGLLMVREGKDGPQISLLPYGDNLPEGKSTTLVGGRSMQYFLGNYGPDAVTIIDPEATDNTFRLVKLPTRRVHFAVDPMRAKFAYVFTEDGKLNRLNVLSGEIDGALALTEPYSMDGHWSDPRPRIAVAGDTIVVTDPLKGVLHTVDARTFTKTADIPVEGKPFNIVAVGGSGETH